MSADTEKRTEDQKRVPSTAAVKSHPVHPILVNFPIALLVTALGADVLYWWTQDAFFARGALWLIGVGAAVGALAALTGFTDFITIRYARQQIGSWSHMLAGVFTVALAAANLLLRWGDPVDAVLPWGLLLSLDTALMMAFTGWLGGKLTFRHLIGSYIEEEEKQALAEIKTASLPPDTRSP
jgi:uncharacterized membrane protein